MAVYSRRNKQNIRLDRCSQWYTQAACESHEQQELSDGMTHGN